MDVEDLLKELEEKSGLTRESLLAKLKEKQNELSGLINMKGAIHLVARDLGVELKKEELKPLQMANIVPGMRRVNVVGRVFRISPVREFERSSGEKGRVVNLFIGDATGFVRLPLWDRQVELVEAERVRVGDVVQILNGIARENIFGEVEIRLGRYGSITSIDAELPSAEELGKRFLMPRAERVAIKDLVPGFFELKGTVVHVFKGKFLFDTCSICGATLTHGCAEHGEVEALPALVISGIIDDGTANVRFVLFREVAQQLVQVNMEEFVKLSVEERQEKVSDALLGRELTLRGRVRRNPRTEQLEVLVNQVEDINILNESKRLVERLEAQVS